MRRRLRAAICATTVLVVALVCGLSPRHPGRVHTMLSLGAAAGVDPDAALPAGFATTVDRATSDQFVRVIADDVDRDGDLDVVASLGSLDLMVWTNDGAGHFTRLASSPHTALQTRPAAPSADGDSLTSNEWIQNDQPRADVESLRARSIDAPATPFSPLVRVAIGHDRTRVRSPRAPPHV